MYKNNRLKKDKMSELEGDLKPNSPFNIWKIQCKNIISFVYVCVVAQFSFWDRGVIEISSDSLGILLSHIYHSVVGTYVWKHLSSTPLPTWSSLASFNPATRTSCPPEPLGLKLSFPFKQAWKYLWASLRFCQTLHLGSTNWEAGHTEVPFAISTRLYFAASLGLCLGDMKAPLSFLSTILNSQEVFLPRGYGPILLQPSQTFG